MFDYSLLGLCRRLKAMALGMVPPFRKRGDYFHEQKRKDMSAMICNCSKAVCSYIRHLESFDINDSSDSSDSG